jgi:serine/threonine protein kinase
MKVMNKSQIFDKKIVRYAMAERDVLSRMNHPFIVKLYYAFQTN